MMTDTDKAPRAKRSTSPRAKSAKANAAKAPTPASKHRHRQASVAALLDQTFGRLADCSPNLWERRAYLMLIGLVYERLATNESEMPTDEIVTLAKVLAENRRADKRTGEGERHREAPSAPNGTLPTVFTRLVKQVYGTDLTPSGPTLEQGNPEAEPARKP
jgi:hypothetical protein